MHQKELIDAAVQRALRKSVRGLAEQIGVSSGVLSEWRNGLKPMPDERVAQLCKIADLDGPTWMAKIHVDRAESPVEKALWKTALDRLSAAAAVVALVAIFGSATPAKAVEIHAVTAHEFGSMHIM